jgi:hypothetical protein
MTTKPKVGKIDRQKLSSNIIMEVYEYNFKEEIERLSIQLETYQFIAMVGYFFI